MLAKLYLFSLFMMLLAKTVVCLLQGDGDVNITDNLLSRYAEIPSVSDSRRKGCNILIKISLQP